MPAPAPIAQAPAPIAPVPVVPLGANEAAKTMLDPKTCSRCRGVVDSGAMFCKFCGNSLVEAKPDVAVSRAPEPPKPAPPEILPHERLDLPKPNGSNSPKPVPVKPSAAPQPVAAANPIAPAPIKQPTAAAALAATPRAASAPPPAATVSPSPVFTKEPSKAPPAPAPTTSRGRLVVIAKSGADGPSYPFGDLFDVGRTEGNVVVPEDPYLSPRHVRIVWNAGKLILRDLGSTNGVYLRLAASRDPAPRRGDGAEVAVPLIDQDMLLVGQQVLRFDVLKEGEGGLGPASEHGTLVFGSPAAPRYARLHQRTVEGITRDVYYIRKTETVLGRESGDVVFTEDPFLSRRHAAIRVLSKDANAPRFALVDMGSSNGTFLKTRADIELAPGDHFRVGQQLFRVDFDGASI
jgi:pSer/pThr/pTyr-binding forkhead associated (FHA) protein